MKKSFKYLLLFLILFSQTSFLRADFNDFLNAAKAGDCKKVRGELRRDRFDINATDKFGWTALHCAVWNYKKQEACKVHNYLGVMTFLVDNKANTRQRNKLNFSPIDLFVLRLVGVNTKVELVGSPYQYLREYSKDRSLGIPTPKICIGEKEEDFLSKALDCYENGSRFVSDNLIKFVLRKFIESESSLRRDFEGHSLDFEPKRRREVVTPTQEDTDEEGEGSVDLDVQMEVEEESDDYYYDDLPALEDA
jgi:hypothetical protein